MDITLLPPTDILTHHSHVSRLLPSPIPNTHTRRYRQSSYFAPTTFLRFPLSSCYLGYRGRGRSPDPQPPADGRCLVDNLPDEIWLQIMGNFEWDEILSLRPVSKRFASLCLSPTLHHTLTLLSLPPSPLPDLLVRHLLPGIRHLHLHLFPYPSPASAGNHPTTVLLDLLQQLPEDQLLSLSLPFSAPYLPPSELGMVLARIGGKLEKLDLRGSGLAGPGWLRWISLIGVKGRGLRELDVGFTSITALPSLSTSSTLSSTSSFPIDSPPSSDLETFSHLRTLSLASCSSLPAAALAEFLATVPHNLEHLDLSRLDQITLPSLMALRVVSATVDDVRPGCTWGEEKPEPTKLKEIKVVGIDHLTRTDVRRLKVNWEDQRRECMPWEPMMVAVPLPRVWGEPRPSIRHSPESINSQLPIPPTPPRTPLQPRNLSPPSSSDSSPESIIGPSTPITPHTPHTPITPAGSSDTINLKGVHPFLQTPPRSVRPSPDRHLTRIKGRDEVSPDGSESDSEDLTSCSNPSTLSGLTNLSNFLDSSELLRDADIAREGSRKNQRDTWGPWERKQREKEKREAEQKQKMEIININIVHSAILESEDEAGYRQFIGEVAAATTTTLGMGR
ncbi:hypothetical protein TREMEDRAFT_63029 [Tremella mesenterica DSM 1558]|uniref:uncharacterized protein n=1 Tax=Tremella mesenterica (strain ATCC 24925 / CBS 8224 / DSM 1558 / NBRC 9311 / NRRL Y-6157 / RJB 2259-6 / UBC 559-6) TaxID=578456 RepID=UPI0003F4A4AC|nr:uncharacterized protein TREMEDRAFT_63029 [Tremella mesenterica DSM 1558]EIW68563.1 hypothetical protein TREMEDRAFT_63029 [Tremella mesenterica DSM 1558]